MAFHKESFAASISSAAVQSVWDFILKGGWMMIPIGICSFVALSIFIERMVSLRRSKVIPASFLPGLKKVLKEKKDNKAAALKYLDQMLDRLVQEDPTLRFESADQVMKVLEDFRETLARRPRLDGKPLTEDEMDALRALGYIQ